MRMYKAVIWAGSIIVPAMLAFGGTSEPSQAAMDEDRQLYAVQLHIHGSLSEGHGRMLNHAVRARELGVDALWWSDHAGSYFVDETLLPTLRFDFEERALFLPEEPGGPPGRGFSRYRNTPFVEATIIDSSASQGDFSMAITSQGGPDPGKKAFAGYRYGLTSKLPRLIQSLYKKPTVTFDARLAEPATPGRDFATVVHLSHTADAGPITFLYLATDGELPPDRPPTYFLRMPTLSCGEWSTITIDPASDAQSRFNYAEDLGLRSVTLGWYVSNDGYSAALVDDFHYTFDAPSGDEILSAQFDDLNALADPSPVHFVGYEISGGSNSETDGYPPHINVFAPVGVPDFPDWTDPRFDDDVYPRNLIHWAQDQQYVTSYNHLFGADASQISEGETRVRRNMVLLNGAFGADLLEVGYADRRQPIESFLWVWDQLPQWSAFPTGIGTSDEHNTFPWDVTVNRFVTWVYIPELTQANVLDELVRGRACFGDPYIVGGDAFVAVRDHERRFDMGDVVVSQNPVSTLRILGKFDLPSMELAVITVHEESADTSFHSVTSPFRVFQTVTLTDECHTRAELRDPTSGKIALASNPVYYRREAPDRALPGMRYRRIVGGSE